MERLINKISEKLNSEITGFSSVSCGDISSAYLLEMSKEKFFLKVNCKSFAKEMFQAEQQGLQAIEATKTIAVPHVYLVDEFENKSFLLMNYVEGRRPNTKDFKHLGRNLAHLHLCSNSEFGFSSDNFIGSLPQSNIFHADWTEFYWKERIFPQLDLAKRNGQLTDREIPTEEVAIRTFNQVFGNTKPALLHGDLWGGNYLIATDGTPFLVDPAIYYGHPMVDIAMSYLFGGFDEEFYTAYHEIIPKTEYYNEQIELYQLYYLLVHLNLFGKSYRSRLMDILERYF